MNTFYFYVLVTRNYLALQFWDAQCIDDGTGVDALVARCKKSGLIRGYKGCRIIRLGVEAPTHQQAQRILAHRQDVQKSSTDTLIDPRGWVSSLSEMETNPEWACDEEKK